MREGTFSFSFPSSATRHIGPDGLPWQGLKPLVFPWLYTVSCLPSCVEILFVSFDSQMKQVSVHLQLSSYGVDTDNLKFALVSAVKQSYKGASQVYSPAPRPAPFRPVSRVHANQADYNYQKFPSGIRRTCKLFKACVLFFVKSVRPNEDIKYLTNDMYFKTYL